MIRRVLIGTSLLAALCAPSAASDAGGEFTGRYSSLKPEQRALVDDWMRRFSATIGKAVDPGETYDHLPISTRATFNAVTHALLSTHLTDSAEHDLGSAIQIVGKLDTVNGEILGARGDEQFRIYVQLRPDALDLLEKSAQFQRKDDNTVYHRGYPICYRSKPAAPSIQVSAARDKTLADIDVDYRSSGFPKALLNGHLSASNSDVRAGTNDEVHNRQWNGLNNWWRSLLSLPSRASTNDEQAEASRMTAKSNVKTKAKPADAVYDLLNQWLVERKPETVLAYFAQEAFLCAELESDEPQDRGMAPFRLLKALQRADGRIGPVSKVSDAVTAVSPDGAMSRAKPVRHPHEAQFALYDVREDAGEQFNCVNRLNPGLLPAKAASARAFGKYYGAVFRLGARKSDEAVTLAILWGRNANGWRIIAYDVDPLWDSYRAPNVSVTPPPAPTEYTAAPPGLTGRVEGFLTAWLVRRNVEEASGYLSAEANSCAAEADAGGGPEGQEQVRAAMQRVADEVGSVKALEMAIVPPAANHPDIQIVRHPSDKKYALVALPEYMGDALECAKRRRGASALPQPSGAKNYGKYYAMGLKLRKTGEDSGVLWAVWTRDKDVWKLSSYTVLTP